MLRRRKKEEENTIVNDVLTTPEHAAELEARLKAKQDVIVPPIALSAGRCPTCGTEATGARCEVDGTEL